MEKSVFAREMVKRNILDADYLLNKTYLLLKEEKLFLEVVRHLFEASKNLINFTIEYAYEQEEIPRVPKTPIEKISVISSLKSDPQKNKISKSYLSNLTSLYWRLKELDESTRNDIMSFKKQDKYVICKKDYKVEVISYSSLNSFLKEVRNLHIEVGKLN